jgi:Zn-dependent membrane protease YugP
MLTQQEHEGAKDALTWAARTYVVAALGSIALYCIMFPFIWEAARRD